jgi:NAD(P)-dependent dehydrogenase (short-subunit alcohol dehydrogenase family)
MEVAAGEAVEGAPGVKKTEGPATVVNERDLPVSAGVEEVVIESEASSVAGEKVRAVVSEEVATAVETAAAQDATAVEDHGRGVEDGATERDGAAAGGRRSQQRAQVRVVVKNKASSVKALFDKAEESFGKAHIVVSSARIIPTNFPNLVETTEEEWDWVAAVNTKRAFRVSREAAKRIPLGGSGGSGRIVNITTILVTTALPGNVAYTTNNGVVDRFTKTLAKEFGEVKSKGGSTKAPDASTEKVKAVEVTPESKAEIFHQVQYGELATFRELAEWVTWFAEDGMNWNNVLPKVARTRAHYAPVSVINGGIFLVGTYPLLADREFQV